MKSERSKVLQKTARVIFGIRAGRIMRGVAVGLAGCGCSGPWSPRNAPASSLKSLLITMLGAEDWFWLMTARWCLERREASLSLDQKVLLMVGVRGRLHRYLLPVSQSE
jgi:hypothetical protein